MVQRFSIGCGLGVVGSILAIVFFMSRLHLTDDDVGPAAGLVPMVMGVLGGVSSIGVGWMLDLGHYLAGRGRPTPPSPYTNCPR